MKAAADAAPAWRAMSYDDRASIILKAADLLAGPWRDTLNAATMLGQSKTSWQAEIDAACELIDFWRFNVHYARQILAEQPIANSPGIWNRTDHRPLEGFVFAITPFNFTAIAGNLPTAPALMGNTVIWKPSPTQQFAAHLTMELLEEAGMPPGVINMVPGDGIEVSEWRCTTPTSRASTSPGRRRPSSSSGGRSGRSSRRTAPTRGSSARPAARTYRRAPLGRRRRPRVAMIRGAFEFQGQKCSAASRAYVPLGVEEDKGRARRGDREPHHGPTTDLSNFMGAVIDDRAFASTRRRSTGRSGPTSSRSSPGDRPTTR